MIEGGGKERTWKRKRRGEEAERKKVFVSERSSENDRATVTEGK